MTLDMDKERREYEAWTALPSQRDWGNAVSPWEAWLAAKRSMCTQEEGKVEPVAFLHESPDKSRRVLGFSSWVDPMCGDWTTTRLYTAPINAEAIRDAALEEAAKIHDAEAAGQGFSAFSSQGWHMHYAGKIRALLSSASQPKEQGKLERIRQLAECGVSHGLLADDYCQRILDVIGSQPKETKQRFNSNERQLIDWLLRDPMTGEKLSFAGAPEAQGSLSRVRMRSGNGNDWTLIAGLREGWETPEEKAKNFFRIAKLEAEEIQKEANASQPAQSVDERDELQTVLTFLLGEGELDGRWFGDEPPKRRPFWWRKHLRAALKGGNHG